MATNQPAEYFSPADISAAQDYGQQIRDNPQSILPPLAGWGQKKEAEARDYIMSGLMGLRNSVQAAQQGAQLGDPVLASLSALGSAASTPSAEAIAQARQAAQAKAQLEALHSIPLKHLSPALAAEHPEIANLPMGAIEPFMPMLQRHAALKDAQLNDSERAAMSKLASGHALSSDDLKGVRKGTIPESAMMKPLDTKEQDKAWTEIEKRHNPTAAPRGTLLGIAGQANASADRALRTLSSKVVTNQAARGVEADIAKILKGAAPDHQDMVNQSYQTTYGQIQALIQKISGKPQDGVPQPILDELRRRVLELKDVDNKIIKDNLSIAEITNRTAIQKDPARWQEFTRRVLGTTEYGDFGGAKTPTVSDQASYDALPKGSQYIGPDGNVRTKR
jgi:hypothetical protein